MLEATRPMIQPQVAIAARLRPRNSRPGTHTPPPISPWYSGLARTVDSRSVTVVAPIRPTVSESVSKIKNGTYKCAGGSKTYQTDLERNRCYRSHQVRQCGKCGESFSNSGALVSHMVSQHGATKIYCPKCNRIFSSNEDLDQHMDEKHSDHRPWECTYPDCNKTFRTKGNMDSHANNAHKGGRERRQAKNKRRKLS